MREEKGHNLTVTQVVSGLVRELVCVEIRTLDRNILPQKGEFAQKKKKKALS